MTTEEKKQWLIKNGYQITKTMEDYYEIRHIEGAEPYRYSSVWGDSGCSDCYDEELTIEQGYDYIRENVAPKKYFKNNHCIEDVEFDHGSSNGSNVLTFYADGEYKNINGEFYENKRYEMYSYVHDFEDGTEITIFMK